MYPPQETRSSRFRVVMAQLNLMVGDIAANAALVSQSAIKARDDMQADVIVFPELTLTGYPPEDILLRQDFHERVEQALQAVLEASMGIAVILGYPRREGKHLYNAASMLQDGQIVATYYKQILPNYSVFDEKRYFEPGNRACVAQVGAIPVGISICEDLWHPGLAHQAAQAGARVLFNINASPFHVKKRAEREQALRLRVREARIPIVYVNLVGGQDELVFDGDSFVIDAHGDVAVSAAPFQEGLFPVDMDVIDEAVIPLAGAQAPALSEEESVYQAIVTGVRDYINKNRFNGVVIGISGGIDSALTLAIAVDAIGRERVEAVMMPSRYTADMSIEDARLQCEQLGVEYHVIPIEPPFKAFLQVLEQEFVGTQVDVTEQNIQARCRGIILMAISNKKGKIVLTTGNKSEMSVGYATLYGDMAGGFAPIKDVPKTMVYRLARYRNNIAEVIPGRVIDRAPSAELAPDQRDEDELLPYRILDPLLELYVEQDQALEEMVAQGFDEAAVRRVVALVNRSEYKRRQAPLGVRITRRAFGRDRRYPITCGYK